MSREFAVPPPGPLPWLVIGSAVIAIPLAVFGALFATQSPDSLPLVALLALPAVLLVGAGLLLAMRRRRVTLENGQLVVRAALYTQRIPVDRLAPDSARILDLREHREWLPRLKTNGLNAPGFWAGHFRGRKLARLFCLLTDRSRVLVLPEHGGRTLLLSLERPQGLLDALRSAR